ncbi:MAG: hypothetical protein RMM53_07775, partial [Bacteroidia bacterium]|nr:hypothetical protein [Bacteroidia bacterium]
MQEISGTIFLKPVQHLNHLTLAALGRWLTEKGGAVTQIYSQEKDELIVEFSSFALRVGCRNDFQYLVPTAIPRRASKNTKDLFIELWAKELTRAYSPYGERCLVMEFKAGMVAVCQMYGSRSNFWTVRDGVVLERFRKSLPEPTHAIPPPLPRIEYDGTEQSLEVGFPYFDKYFRWKLRDEI